MTLSNTPYCMHEPLSDVQGAATFACGDGATIPAAFVDDRICDCCDGSDEGPGSDCVFRC